MDTAPKDLETVYRDLRRFGRQFPSGLPVRAIGYLPTKRDWVHRTFDRLTFCFILSGDGHYHCDNRTWRVESPCVFMGYPGTALDYGPRESWEELYINFVAELVPAAEARGLVNRERPLWPIHDAGAARRDAVALLEALGDLDSFGRVDLIDRMCEKLIVESLISAASPPLGERDRAVQAVRTYIEGHYMERLDPDELALERGLSPSDFRRRWAAMIKTPPGQFITQLRVREACRLLAQTDKNVGEVARMVGFGDQLYFTRRFTRLIGEPPSDYRKRNR